MIKNEFYLVEVGENIVTGIENKHYILKSNSINNIINALRFNSIEDAEHFIEYNKLQFLEEDYPPTIIKIKLNIDIKEEEIKEINY